jgi:hypothetical protein
MTEPMESIKTLVELVLLPVLGWVVKRIDNLGKDVQDAKEAIQTTKQSIAEIRVALVGLDGKNGMRSEIRELRRVQEHGEDS